MHSLMSVEDDDNVRPSHQQFIAVDAREKRTAWKNSVVTGASEKDSLLTSSGDDRFSASFELRPIASKDSRQSSGVLNNEQEGSSHHLRVPSPSNKSRFYATSPSTDEGIGAEEHVGQSGSPKKEGHDHYFEKSDDTFTVRTLTRSPCNGANSRRSTKEATPQHIHRQASEQLRGASQRSRKDSFSRNNWSSVASCCELTGGQQGVDDGPVLLYSRTRENIHSSQAKLPAVIERRETEVIARNGSLMSRIVSSSTGETAAAQQCANASRNEQCGSRVSTPNTMIKSNRDQTSFISKREARSNLTSTSSSTSRDEVDAFPSSSSSFANHARKDSASTSKTRSRNASSRASVLAGAIVASGNMLAETSQFSSKDNQKSLTEHLMSIGASDQRRVQGIVEDILCEMGEKRIIQYKEAFAKFDKDSSGIISSKQLRTLLRTLGHNPSDKELRELVNQVDMDENGKIDFNEFIILIGYFDKTNNENEDLIDIFRVFDHDDKGSIDISELGDIWSNFLQDTIPDDSFKEMLTVIDKDGNGEINRVELLQILSTR